MACRVLENQSGVLDQHFWRVIAEFRQRHECRDIPRAVGLPDGSQPRPSHDDLIDMGLARHQFFDPRVAGEEQFIDRKHCLRATVRARFGDREIVDKYAAPLLEASRADVDNQLRVVIGEHSLDVPPDLIVESPIEISATDERSHHREAERPLKKRPAAIDAARKNWVGSLCKWAGGRSADRGHRNQRFMSAWRAHDGRGKFSAHLTYCHVAI